MQPTLEIFFASIKDDNILYVRQTSDLAHADTDPDVLVNAAWRSTFPSCDGSDVVIHGTSWRYDPLTNTIPHTYLVYGHNLPLEEFPNLSIIALKNLHISQRSPQSTISQVSVLSHAMRHLSFLRRTDPAVRAVLDQSLIESGKIGAIEEHVAGVFPNSIELQSSS